jgi:hypothetical protein
MEDSAKEDRGMEAIKSDFQDLGEAVAGCIRAKLYLPALMLIYTWIDIIASFEKSGREGVRKSFTRWADRYLLPEKNFGCSGMDLYSARCGVLHQMSCNSDLINSGKARRIYYAWGTASADMYPTKELVIHINSLLEVLVAGTSEYFIEVTSDPARTRVVAAKAYRNILFSVPEDRYEPKAPSGGNK